MSSSLRGPVFSGRFVSMAVVLLLVSAGCGPGGGGPTVLEIEGKSISLDQLRGEYEARNGVGSFDPLTKEEKEEFLETIANKEVLMRISRDETGELHPPFDRLVREANMKWLMKRLETKLTDPIHADSAGTEAMFDRFNKELRLSWFVHPVDSIATLAHEQIEGGRPFAEVAREYSAGDSIAELGGDVGWTTAENVGDDFAAELYLEGHGPGYLSEIRSTPRGKEFYQIVDEREFDIRSKEGAEERFPHMIQRIRSRQRLEAFADSLLEADGFVLRKEILPLVMERMMAYWDSLRANPDAVERVTREFEPPASLFSDEELKQVICELRGKEITLGEYFEGLREVPMTLWPGGDRLEIVEKQINRRVLIGLQLDAARAMGLERGPEYERTNRMNMEKFRLEQLTRELVDSLATPTEAEIRRFYDERRETYTKGDRIRFSYAVFPEKAEADRFYAKAKTETGEWWVGRFTRLIENRPDVKVVANTETYDLTQPLPPEIEPLVELGRDKNVTDVLRPVRHPEGGWMIGRVLFRERPGLIPFERTKTGIERVLEKRKTDAAIDSLVTVGRERYGVRTYPERLEAGA